MTLGVIIHWLTNDGQCFLSEMDYDKNEEPNGYTKHMLEKIGITMDAQSMTIVSHLIVLIPCLYSLYKLNQMNIHPYLII